MPRGGARSKSGPAPKLDSGRSDRRGLKVTTLPATGCRRKPPTFPMASPTQMEAFAEVDPNVLAELEAIEERIWTDTWKLPQAVAWHAEPWRKYVVAQWTRAAAICETPLAKAADRTSMLRLQEEIGLTATGLARNGWTIGTPEPKDAKPTTTRTRRKTKPASSRDRLPLQVINGGR